MVGWTWIPGRNNACMILFSYNFKYALLFGLVQSLFRCLKVSIIFNNLIAVINHIGAFVCVCFRIILRVQLIYVAILTFAKCLRQSLPLLTCVMTLITFWSATGIYLVESRSHLARVFSRVRGVLHRWF